MIRLIPGCLPLAILIACGCTGDNPRRGRDIENVPVKLPDSVPPGTTAASVRVDLVGQQILKANPDIKIKPAFIVIGVPELTVFHMGPTALYISEAVVSKCELDGDKDPTLAAVLCSQLGQMVSEARQQQPDRKDPDVEPPLIPERIGSGTVGNYDPTNTDLAERAFFEEKHPRNRSRPPLCLDPKELARSYMMKAGYNPNELVRIAPWLQLAESNPKYQNLLAPPRRAPPPPNQ
jgi:hypothetical protein